MKLKLTLTLTFLIILKLSFSQRVITGYAYEIQERKKDTKTPLILANVYWEGTTKGVYTDDKGNFKIDEPAAYPAKLVISSVGFISDTTSILEYKKSIKIGLKSIITLDEFQLKEKQSGTYINTIDPLHIETLTGKELNKAACCNISESFETNASVDVNFTDAVSGRKKIEMLGLDGIYTQIQAENLPLIRGLSSAYGMNFIPGTWAHSIQIKKGAGSVVNGYESITGQINIELLKPDVAEQLFVNGYGNARGRMELNIHGAQKLSKRWSSMSFGHVSTQNLSFDNNNDNFEDNPLKSQYNFFNRWKYIGDKRMFQIGIRGVVENLKSGQIEANELEPLYHIGVESKQFEVFTKNGFLFPEKPYKSIGVLNTLRFHDHNSRYGQKIMEAQQYSGYLNVIYQTIIDNTAHTIKMGGSLVYDNFDKQLNKNYKFGRVETVPGIFTEYTYKPDDKSALVLGLRSDYHNQFGLFLTPRLHYKYSFTEQSAFRVSAGRGFRTTHPILENPAAMASSRTIIFNNDLEPEIAWNYGTSFTHNFLESITNMGITLDYYYTNFNNQVVVDLENPREIAFYNLRGESYSHSLQAEYHIDLTPSLELKAAYKWYNIKTDFNGELKTKPLTPKNRALINIGYMTNFDKWKFDLTGKWFGVSRIPSTEGNLPENTVATNSDSYYLLGGQITRSFKNFDLYAGGENLTGFTQKNPIIAADDPNGSNFDASLIWGPVMGRNIYFGFRFKIK
jgi:outer membrane receptor protein involved in Fe transport